MKRRLNLVIALFEKADIRLLVFILLCLNFLSFSLTSNEEAYLPLAKQFLDPGWIPGSFTFSEWPGNRLLFQIIAGWGLKFLSFEQVAFFGRLLIFALISLPVGSIIKKFRIANLPFLIVFQLYLIRQTYFAGEFIFGDFEPKSFAYIMVFAGLNCLLDKKYIQAVLWSVPAAFFHILVGGWFFLLSVLFTFFSTKNIILAVKQGLLFILLILPLVIYLAREVLGSGSVIHGVNIDQVYVFFRNPHHTAPLAETKHVARNIFQIAVTAVVFALTIFVFRKKKGAVFDELYLLNVIIFTILFVSLSISLIDHKGVFLKFYPFRLAALGEFLMYFYVFKLIESKWSCPVFLQVFAVLAGFYLITAATFSNIRDFSNSSLKQSYKELTHFISENTAPADVILPLKDYNLSLSRMTRREVYVIFKCDPGGGEKIYEWYHRVGERKKLNENPEYIGEILKCYRINYLLSDHQLPQNERLTPVFKNSDYYLYKTK
jgi:hypothetical protein